MYKTFLELRKWLKFHSTLLWKRNWQGWDFYSVFSHAFPYDEIREFKDYDVSSLEEDNLPKKGCTNFFFLCPSICQWIFFQGDKTEWHRMVFKHSFIFSTRISFSVNTITIFTSNFMKSVDLITSNVDLWDRSLVNPIPTRVKGHADDYIDPWPS